MSHSSCTCCDKGTSPGLQITDTEVLELFGSFLNRTLVLRSKQLQDQVLRLQRMVRVSLHVFLSQLHAMCIEGRTLFVADTAFGAIKMITPTNSLCEFLGQLDLLCKSFGVHLKGVQGEAHAIDEAVASLSIISLACDAWVKKVQDKMGRNNST